jgi:23S rRNA pseudouridine1911/1915/1917 synthase
MNGAERHVTADRGDSGRRLDLVLRRHLGDVPAATRTRIQAWIEDGRVAVNGIVIRRAAARPAAGDVVSVQLPSQPSRRTMAAEAASLEILAEDDCFVAVNKPAGLVVHPGFRHPAGTLMNALLWHASAWTQGQRPSIIGRLDKLTSGVVVVAKTTRAHAEFQRVMNSTAARKEYLAIVYGQVKTRRGEIRCRLSRHSSDRRCVVASDTVGRPSLTRFERLGLVAAPRAGLSLLKCRLITGRTHQIRVHLSARGWPIVGDPMYGEERWRRIDDLELAATLRAFNRQALHAWKIALPHPFTGEQLEIEAPLPPDLDRLLETSGLMTSRIRNESKL